MNSRFSTASPGGKPAVDASGRLAFTLVELIVVIAIIVTLMSLLVPAIKGIKGGADITSSAYKIAGALDQARAYAMANNTYVWVGIAETDVSNSASASPQTAGIGRVALAIVASRDGTRNYDVSNANLSAPPFTLGTSTVRNGATLVAIAKLQYFENMHLAAPGVLNGVGVSANPDGSVGTGSMQRPHILSHDYVLVGGDAASNPSVTQIAWPLGSDLGSGQYQFTTVINFDPQGVARIQYKTNQDTIVKYMEIGLIPKHRSLHHTAQRCSHPD
jgi:Tfp pilus assembly protein FimT